MKKQKIPRKVISKSQRALKSWAKGGSRMEGDSDATPGHTVGMKPRLKSAQQRVFLDEEHLLEGRVLASGGRGWIIELLDSSKKNWDKTDIPAFFECTPSRSILSDNHAATLISVGDRVLFKSDDSAPILPSGYAQGIIQYVRERNAKLARKAAGNSGIEQVIAANIDSLVIVCSAAEPFYNRRLIDRYLIAAEVGELAPILCVNKMDLMDEQFILDDLSVYPEILDIPLILVSAETGQGIEELRKVLRGKTSVFSGQSGVGKSTLVNTLLGDEVQITLEVSEKTQKGMHATTSSRMFRLPGGGYIVDTPGIREFGILNVSRAELALYFHDFDEFREECKFMPCSHSHEPHCAVREAVETGEIDTQRYSSYQTILETLDE